MRFGNFDFSGIKRVVQNKKYLWVRMNNRWVKYKPAHPPELEKTDIPCGGMSLQQMHMHIEEAMTSQTHRLMFHGDTINIYRQEGADDGTKEIIIQVSPNGTVVSIN
jgi:hypothetical protein